MATTPSGTRTCLILSPFGVFQPPSSSPTGSVCPITSRKLATIPLILLSSSKRRSIIDSLIPLARAESISILFAAIIEARFLSTAAATASRAAFFSQAFCKASFWLAVRKDEQIFSRFIWISSPKCHSRT